MPLNFRAEGLLSETESALTCLFKTLLFMTAAQAVMLFPLASLAAAAVTGSSSLVWPQESEEEDSFSRRA